MRCDLLCPSRSTHHLSPTRVGPRVFCHCLSLSFRCISTAFQDFKAKNNEVLKRLKKSRSEQRQLEKFEERKLEQMQMEFLRYDTAFVLCSHCFRG